MKNIIIGDVGTISRYELTGTTLQMVKSGGCANALAEVSISEDMPDSEIEEMVRSAWLDGYVGNAEENNLSVCVE